MKGLACGGRPTPIWVCRPSTILRGWEKTTWRNSDPIGTNRRPAEGNRRSSRQQSQRVVAIDAPQDVVRQEQAIDIPASLARRMRRILEVLVGRLQKPEVQPIHAGLGHQVRAEQDAVGVLQEEFARGVRLAPEFRATRPDVYMNIGM